MKKLFVGIFVGLAILPIAALLSAKMGLLPVATEAPALPFEKFFVKLAMRNSIKPETVPFELHAESPRMIAGAKNYLNHCAGCHGLPVTPDSKMARAMFPRAPQFFQEEDNLGHDKIERLHWKIKNGIRLTGMPAYKNILSNDEIWEVAWMLKKSKTISGDLLKILRLEKKKH